MRLWQDTGTRRLVGFFLLAGGLVIIYLALPSWLWLLALGGGLITLGWAILREGKGL